MGRFRELKVWKKAMDLAMFIYKETGQNPISKDFGLRDQLRRAAVSIPSNIAEGDELDTNKQSIRSFYIARGSSAEVLTQAILAHKIGYFSDETHSHIVAECESISAMLTKLIKTRAGKN